MGRIPYVRYGLTIPILLAVMGLGGCSDESNVVALDSNLTTNFFSVYVMGPPYSDLSGTPLVDATVIVQFKDLDHSDPVTHQYEMRAEAQGITDLQGEWSCHVSYIQRDSEAADKVFIWVSPAVYGQEYTQRQLDDQGRTSAIIGLAQP